MRQRAAQAAEATAAACSVLAEAASQEARSDQARAHDPSPTLSLLRQVPALARERATVDLAEGR